MNADVMETRLMATFPDAEIQIFDLTGGGDHFEVEIKSQTFSGLSRIRQHQAVMEVFRSELASGELHALSLRTQAKN